MNLNIDFRNTTVKTKLFSLLALVLLSAIPAFGQLTSSPLEPGLYDYYKNHRVPGVQLINPKKMIVGGMIIEWISPEQITVSAEIANMSTGTGRGTMSEAMRDSMVHLIDSYNTDASVGTLTFVESNRIRITHHLNPKEASLPQMTHAVKEIDAAVTELKQQLAPPALPQEPIRFIH
jgi:hypothetical protein